MNKDLQLAKQLYFNGIVLTDIADQLNIPLEDLRKAAFGESEDATCPACWHAQLQQYGAAALDVQAYTKFKPLVLKHAEANIMKKITQEASRMAQSDEEWGVTEVKTAVDAVEKIDKMTRLEGGDVTERVGVDISHLSMREIQEMRRQVTPFTVEADYEEVEREDEEEGDEAES